MATKSLEQLKRDAEKLQAKISFLEQSQSKLIDFAAEVRASIKAAGFEVADVIKHLTENKPRAARGSAVKKKPESQDNSGELPVPGTTYKDKSWPAPWTAQGKRSPKHVLATIKAGKNWKQLVAK